MKKLLVCSLLVFASALLLEQGLRASAQPAINAASAQASEKLSGDTPKTTVLGNAFIAPKDWSIRVKGPATMLEAPEGNSWVALVDVEAKTQDEALAAAWQAYKPDCKVAAQSQQRSARPRWLEPASNLRLSDFAQRFLFAVVFFAALGFFLVVIGAVYHRHSFAPKLGQAPSFSQAIVKAALAAQPGRISRPRSGNDKPCRFDRAVLDGF